MLTRHRTISMKNQLSRRKTRRMQESVPLDEYTASEASTQYETSMDRDKSAVRIHRFQAWRLHVMAPRGSRDLHS